MADRRARFVEERRAEGLAYGGVGADLREARERMGLELADVAVALRIQFVHLDALEHGRFQELPGPAYAIGFIRSYARYLRLDGDAAAAQFKSEASIAPSRGRLVAPEPLGEARKPRGLLILASILLLAAVYGGWVWLQERDRMTLEPVAAPPQSAPAAPAASPSRSEDAAPRPAQAVAPPPSPAPAPAPAPQASAVAPPPSPSPSSSPAPAPASAPQAATVAPGPGSAPQQAVASSETGSQAAAEPTEDDDESTPPPSPNAPAASDPPTLAAPPPPSVGAATAQVFGLDNQDARVVLRAKADSWVRIRGTNNELILERTLRTGDTYLVPNRPDLLLWTGNAGGLEVLVDGAPLPPLGPSGAARRDIHLDPDRLRRGG